MSMCNSVLPKHDLLRASDLGKNSVVRRTPLLSNRGHDPTVATVSISTKLVCRHKSLRLFTRVGKYYGHNLAFL